MSDLATAFERRVRPRLVLALCPVPDLPGDCWIWPGFKTKPDPHGYGQWVFEGKNLLVHRTSYELLIGPIPEGLDCDHLCRVRACCNPGHLEPVTRAENMRRGDLVQRSRAECPQGHPYAGDNLYLDPRGWRGCKACRAAAKARSQA